MCSAQTAIRKTCDSADATEKLAFEMSTRLGMNEWIGLTGPLGAGKSVFVRALARALGATEPMPSPTYTILNVYEGRCSIFHVDCYRVESIDELDYSGVTQYFTMPGICLVEWAEKVRPSWPNSGWCVTIDITGPNERRIQIEPFEDRSS